MLTQVLPQLQKCKWIFLIRLKWLYTIDKITTECECCLPQGYKGPPCCIRPADPVDVPREADGKTQISLWLSPPTTPALPKALRRTWPTCFLWKCYPPICPKHSSWKTITGSSSLCGMELDSGHESNQPGLWTKEGCPAVSLQKWDKEHVVLGTCHLCQSPKSSEHVLSSPPHPPRGQETHLAQLSQTMPSCWTSLHSLKTSSQQLS